VAKLHSLKRGRLRDETPALWCQHVLLSCIDVLFCSCRASGEGSAIGMLSASGTGEKENVIKRPRKSCGTTTMLGTGVQNEGFFGIIVNLELKAFMPDDPQSRLEVHTWWSAPYALLAATATLDPYGWLTYGAP